MSDDFVEGLVVGGVVGHGIGRRGQRLAGPEFPASYQSGHPAFPKGDPLMTKHHLVVTDDQLLYTRGANRDVTFAVPRDRIVDVCIMPKTTSIALVRTKGGNILKFSFSGLTGAGDCKRFVALMTAAGI
jgi:hypothetical protein